MLKNHYKEIYHDTNIAKVMLEYHDNRVYAHIIVKEKSIESYKRIKNGFIQLKNLLGYLGYDAVYAYTNNKRFCDFIGPNEYLGNTGYIPEEGKSFDVVKWEI